MDHEQGLRALKAYAQGTAWQADYTVYEARLLGNLRDEALYGPTDQSRRDRAQIVGQLNRLALSQVGISFNDLCLGQVPPSLSAPPASSSAELTRMWETLRDLCSLAELQSLCFTLGIDWDTLPGAEKLSKARELVLYLARRNELDRLRDAVRHERGVDL